MGVRARGVSAIKTLSAVRGIGIHTKERHVQQFQIACLELERSRRVRERQAAMNRVKTLDARLLEIELLIRNLQEELGATSSDDTSCGKPMHETRAAANEKRRTLRY
ncbi:MAG TPA: hypothetical protein VM425_07475 [Myxococcota bacterium]|nr:hypothetical protein [Myxococcota bacterium]